MQAETESEVRGLSGRGQFYTCTNCGEDKPEEEMFIVWGKSREPKVSKNCRACQASLMTRGRLKYYASKREEKKEEERQKELKRQAKKDYQRAYYYQRKGLPVPPRKAAKAEAQLNGHGEVKVDVRRKKSSVISTQEPKPLSKWLNEKEKIIQKWDDLPDARIQFGSEPVLPQASVAAGWMCPLCRVVYSPIVSECRRHQ